MKYPLLTPRDQSLLTKLDSFGVLSTRQIIGLVFPGVQTRTVLRRLRILERRKLIQRVTGLQSGEFAWILTANGQKLVGVGGLAIHINKNTLDHDILFNTLRIRLELAGVGLNWMNGHSMQRTASLGRSPRDRELNVIPDGLFVLSHQGGVRVTAVELELHAKARTRYRKVFGIYAFKKVGLLWYWVSTAKLGRLLQKEWTPFGAYRTGDFLYWSTINELLGDLSLVRLHTSGKTILLNDLCSLKESGPNSPAHCAAHAVGKEAKIVDRSLSSNL